MEKFGLDWKWIIGSLLIPIALMFYSLNQAPYKELSLTVLSQNKVISINPFFADNVKVYHNNMLISNAYLVTFKVENTGTIPIERANFDSPLTVSFEAKILQASITGVSQKDLSVPVRVKNNHILIDPFLLNAQESFTMQVLLDGDPPLPSFYGRISGVSYTKQFAFAATEQAFTLKSNVGVWWTSLLMMLLIYSSIAVLCAIDYSFWGRGSDHVLLSKRDVIILNKRDAIISCVGLSSMAGIVTVSVIQSGIASPTLFYISLGVFLFVITFSTRYTQWSLWHKKAK